MVFRRCRVLSTVLTLLMTTAASAQDVMQPGAAAGMRHDPRATGQLVQGQAPQAATVAAPGRAGRRPCGMCQP